jgi:hypothetical protein
VNLKKKIVLLQVAVRKPVQKKTLKLGRSKEHENVGELPSARETSEGSLMYVKRQLGYLAAAVMLVAFGVAGVANAAEPFTLTSQTFKDGTLMPKKVANKNPQNSNCVGG